MLDASLQNTLSTGDDDRWFVWYNFIIPTPFFLPCTLLDLNVNKTIQKVTSFLWL